ncbi:tripartite tricarboxylate transporter substrate binding protein [Rhabdaerophilum sp. SD176]|uniref:Bug family tripartite tricarboxylate transporter substrate binding protein n=1 Tax=Rhabdaerophilum sp. SD176 TaxID=2983548 RepID=UPI0024DF8870|nr:tripartite tricarboxylate transporter substrate binding protein [Rhabdaerophilum sp. SD176]
MTLGLAASTLGLASARAQQQYPSKPIKLIVPYAAGGGTDTIARAVAQGIGEAIGQTMIVENNGAAGGNIATQQAAFAEKDGYTVLMANQGPMVVNPHLFKSMKVDTLKAFDPVTLLASAPLVVVVPKDSKFKTLQELIAFGRANTGKLNYGSAGNGSASHLATMLLERASGLNAIHIPYRGAGPAISDLISAKTDFMVTTFPSVLGQIQGGLLRALAETSKKRSPIAPEIPAVAELGWPDYEAGAWYGFVVPTGTPKPIIERLRAATLEALKSPLLMDRLAKDGATPIGNSPEEFGTMMANEHKRWGELIATAGLKHD